MTFFGFEWLCSWSPYLEGEVNVNKPTGSFYVSWFVVYWCQTGSVLLVCHFKKSGEEAQLIYRRLHIMELWYKDLDKKMVLDSSATDTSLLWPDCNRVRALASKKWINSLPCLRYCGAVAGSYSKWKQWESKIVINTDFQAKAITKHLKLKINWSLSIL